MSPEEITHLIDPDLPRLGLGRDLIPRILVSSDIPITVYEWAWPASMLESYNGSVNQAVFRCFTSEDYGTWSYTSYIFPVSNKRSIGHLLWEESYNATCLQAERSKEGGDITISVERASTVYRNNYYPGGFKGETWGLWRNENGEVIVRQVVAGTGGERIGKTKAKPVFIPFRFPRQIGAVNMAERTGVLVTDAGLVNDRDGLCLINEFLKGSTTD